MPQATRITAVLAALVSASSANPKLRTSDGNIIANVADNADFGVEKDGVTQYWSDITGGISTMTGDISEIDRRARQLETTLMGDTSSGSGSGSSTESVTTYLSRLEQVNTQLLAESATQTSLLQQLVNLSLATEASREGPSFISASVIGAHPSRMSAGGGNLTIGGRNFIPNVANMYSCEWQMGALVVTSTTGSATSEHNIECQVPRWPRPPATHEWVTNLTVKEYGVEIPNAIDLQTTFFATAPTMTHVDDVEIDTALLNNSIWTLPINVDDVDGDAFNVQLRVQSSNAQLFQRISISGQGISREIQFQFAQPRGVANITLTVTDSPLGLSRNQTFRLLAIRTIGASLDNLLYYNGFDQSNCEDPQFPTNVNGARNSWCRTTPVFTGGGNTMSAYFNNQDGYRITYPANAIVLGNTWTLSVWIMSNTCSNNQIPIFWKKNGNSHYMIDHHARARLDGFLYAGHSGQSCYSWQNNWKHHVYRDDGSRIRVWVDNNEITSFSYNSRRNPGYDLEGAWLEYLGTRPSFGTNGLGGYMDELIIWNRALDVQEIDNVYRMKQRRERYALNF